MHEMTPEVIARKRQICQETLSVIEKIDHEIGVRKGESIFRWHFATKGIFKWHFNAKSIFRKFFNDKVILK
jgi:hypothetical protein